MDAAYKNEIERLYLLMYDQLFVYARCSLRNDSLAEEAVQETFRIACMKPEALCSSQNPKGWLVNTLKNTLSNMARSRATASRILTEYISSQINEITVSEDSVCFELMYENIAEMEEFKLIKEMAIEGKSQLEMAQARGISLDACKKRVERAKKTLRKKIEENVTI